MHPNDQQLLQTHPWPWMNGTAADSDEVSLGILNVPITVTANCELSLTEAVYISASVPIRVRALCAGLMGATVATLPCPGFPVVVEWSDPIDQIDAPVVIAAQRPGLLERRCRISYRMLNEAEQQQIRDIWNGGEAFVRAFPFTIPGEGSSTNWLFAQPFLRMSKVKGRTWSCELELVQDVRGADAAL